MFRRGVEVAASGFVRPATGFYTARRLRDVILPASDFKDVEGRAVLLQVKKKNRTSPKKKESRNFLSDISTIEVGAVLFQKISLQSAHV